MSHCHTQSLLSAKVQQEITEWLQRYPVDQKRSAILQALRLAQEQNQGYLTEPLMNAVADYLGLAYIQVFEVATFYSMYHLEPVGRHVINICTNISCMLSGAEEMLEHFKQRLQINLGETTADGRFTLKEEECLAACVKAPMCQIGKKYYENLTPEKIDSILNELK